MGLVGSGLGWESEKAEVAGGRWVLGQEIPGKRENGERKIKPPLSKSFQGSTSKAG